MLNLRTLLKRAVTWPRIGGILVGLAVPLALVFGLKSLPAETSDFTVDPQTETIIQPLVENQKKVETEIQAYAKSGNFSFENPLIVSDPYHTAPLTALLLFDTPEPVEVSIHIPGKTVLADVDFTFAGFRKHHELPVYGLYANTSNQVTLLARNQAGQETQTIVTLQTEPLPAYLDSVQVVTANPELYSPGMNFTFRDHKYVFDIHGDIRWYSTGTSFQTFTRLNNGHYLFTYPVPDQPNDVLAEQDLLGKVFAVYNIPTGVHHDLIELPNHNLLVTSTGEQGETQGDWLLEIDRKTGHITRRIDLKTVLDPNRTAEIASEPGDWLHLNSIVYDPQDSSLLISARNQSAVVKLSYPEMQIQWILGPHENWSEAFQPYLLAPTGDSFEWQWSQHHATVLAHSSIDGQAILDLLLFDNGNYRSFDLPTALAAVDSYSRVVHYRVNETSRTVEQVWEYGKERGSQLFSISRGSAYALSNGDILGTWSEIARDGQGQPTISAAYAAETFSKIIEVDPATRQVIFEADLTGAVSYRVFRASLYEQYSPRPSLLAAKINETTDLSLSEQVVLLLQPIRQQVDGLEAWLVGASKKAFLWLGKSR